MSTPKKLRCPHSGKKRFPTMLHAEIRAEFLQRDPPLYSYHCAHCGDWHLTRQPNFETILQMNLLRPFPPGECRTR
jgi:DNA-directed RNA polymerase subunit RPC12/RpoP